MYGEGSNAVVDDVFSSLKKYGYNAEVINVKEERIAVF